MVFQNMQIIIIQTDNSSETRIEKKNEHSIGQTNRKLKIVFETVALHALDYPLDCLLEMIQTQPTIIEHLYREAVIGLLDIILINRRTVDRNDDISDMDLL
jgi:hypothetical protein